MTKHPANGAFSIACMAVFAIVYWLADIYAATAALMILLTAQCLFFLVAKRRIEKSVLALWGLVMVMGGLTLLLRDKTFIQLKTTVVYSLFAAILLTCDFIFSKNLPKLALAPLFDAPDTVWRRVSLAFAAYFFLLAICNTLVSYYLSESAWVGIKTFGFPAATLVFTIIVAVCLLRYQKNDSP